MAHEGTPSQRLSWLTPQIALSFAPSGVCLVGLLLDGLTRSSPIGAIAAYLAAGWKPTLNAIRLARQGQPGVDLLMIVAALGAAAIGRWQEGAILLFLFSLSSALEQLAMERTRRSIESLIQLRPRECTIIREEREERVAVETLRVDDQVRVRPGDRFPVDGVVAEGESYADESTLSGESVPVSKRVGDAVFAGSINQRGTLLVRTTKPVNETLLDQVVRMVKVAQERRTTGQTLIESWQRPYVLGVFAASGLLFMMDLIRAGDAVQALNRAMVLLVAASPCAVIAASPAALLSAIARAARMGLLVRGGEVFEHFAAIRVAALDKTGTLTLGRLSVVHGQAWPQSEFGQALRLAASVEQRSEHPLAEALVRCAAAQGANLSPPVEFDSHSGAGVHARVDGGWVGVGREDLFTAHQIEPPVEVLAVADAARRRGQTALLCGAPSHRLWAVFAVQDQPRPEATAAIRALRAGGVERIVVLSGDHARAAEAIGALVGADESRGDLLPAQKVAAIRELSQRYGPVLMVGDGVNDAPALAAAELGIAIGARGSDVALDVADAVLVREDLAAIARGHALARRATARLRQNFLLAFGAIGLLVLSSVFGLPLWLGVLGHEGSTVLVVFNGIRLLWEPLQTASARRQGP